MHISNRFFCVLLLVPLSAHAEPPTTFFTLETAVDTALADNRDLAAARFTVREAEGRLQQAGQRSNPELDLGFANDAAFANDGEYRFSAGLKQRFPITGRLKKARLVGRVDVAMAAVEIKNQERLLAGEVLGRSRELLVLQAKLSANEHYGAILQKLIDASVRRMKFAEVSATDVNLSKLELQQTILAHSLLLNQQQTAIAALNALLGRDPGTPLTISGDLKPVFDSKSTSWLSQDAANRRPDRQMASLATDRSAAELILARAEKWEDWTAGLDYSRDYSRFGPPIGNKTDSFIGVSLSIPLPLKNQNQGRIHEVFAARQRTSAELQALDLRIASEVQAAASRMRRLFDILQQYQNESLPLADDNVTQLQKSYAGGMVGITTIIQAERQAGELRQGYWDAVDQFEQALTAWETAAAIPYNHPVL